MLVKIPSILLSANAELISSARACGLRQIHVASARAWGISTTSNPKRSRSSRTPISYRSGNRDGPPHDGETIAIRLPGLRLRGFLRFNITHSTYRLSLLVTGHWSLVTGHRSLVTGHRPAYLFSSEPTYCNSAFAHVVQ